MRYTLEKDIPVAPRTKYPFRQMEKGASFVVPREDAEKKASYGSLQSNLHHLARLAGIKISTRSLKNGDIRIWRIE